MNKTLNLSVAACILVGCFMAVGSFALALYAAPTSMLVVAFMSILGLGCAFLTVFIGVTCFSE